MDCKRRQPAQNRYLINSTHFTSQLAQEDKPHQQRDSPLHLIHLITQQLAATKPTARGPTCFAVMKTKI